MEPLHVDEAFDILNKPLLMMTYFKKYMMNTFLDVDFMMIYGNLTFEEVLETHKICGLIVLGATTWLMMTTCLMMPFVELETHFTWL